MQTPPVLYATGSLTLKMSTCSCYCEVSYKPRDPAEPAGIMDVHITFHLHVYSGQKPERGRAGSNPQSVPVRSAVSSGRKEGRQGWEGQDWYWSEKSMGQAEQRLTTSTDPGRSPETRIYWQEQGGCIRRAAKREVDGNVPAAQPFPHSSLGQTLCPFGQGPTALPTWEKQAAPGSPRFFTETWYRVHGQ